MAESAQNKQDTAELDAQLGTLLGDATAAPATAQFEETEIGRAVDELLKKDSPKSDDAAAIEALDAELAKLADTMVSGDFTDETTAPAPAPVAEAPKPVVPAPAAPPTVAQRPAPAPVSAPAKPAAPAPPVAQPAAVATPAPAAAPAPEPIAPAAPQPAPAKRGRAAAIGFSLLEVIKPQALKAAMAVSSPLRGRPQIVRDVVGWAALITVFWALCLWGYVLLFRKADPPAPGAPAEASAPAHAAPSHEADSHGAPVNAPEPKRTPPKRSEPYRNEAKRAAKQQGAPKQAAADSHGGH